jgi:hypothetical protein
MGASTGRDGTAREIAVTVASFEGKPPCIGAGTYVHPFKRKYVDLARRYPTGWVPEG